MKTSVMTRRTDQHDLPGPMTSLNPVLTIGYQMEEPLILHIGMSQKQARTRAAELLGMVGFQCKRAFE